MKNVYIFQPKNSNCQHTSYKSHPGWWNYKSNVRHLFKFKMGDQHIRSSFLMLKRNLPLESMQTQRTNTHPYFFKGPFLLDYSPLSPPHPPNTALSGRAGGLRGSGGGTRICHPHQRLTSRWNLGHSCIHRSVSSSTQLNPPTAMNVDCDLLLRVLGGRSDFSVPSFSSCLFAWGKINKVLLPPVLKWSPAGTSVSLRPLRWQVGGWGVCRGSPQGTINGRWFF